MTGDAERLSFLGRGVPPAFEMRTVAIAPGDTLAFVEAEWLDALVVLEAGELEVECRHGGRRRFAPGAVMCLAGLELRSLHSLGPEAALMTAVSRRHITL